MRCCPPHPRWARSDRARHHRDRRRCRWARTCRSRRDRRGRRSRRCTRHPAPGTGTAPIVGGVMICPGPPDVIVCGCWSAAFSASSSAARCASISAAIWISASRRACSPVTACSTSCWFTRSAASLVSSSSLSCCCSLLLPLEVALLALQLRVERGEALGDLVVGLVGPVEQLLPAGGVDRVGGVDERFQRRARVRVREHARAGGCSRAAPAALALVVEIDSCNRPMSSRVCSSWWSAAEKSAAVSLAAARASASCFRAPRRGRRRSLRRPPSRGGGPPPRGS